MSEYIFVTNIFEYSNIRIYSSHSGREDRNVGEGGIQTFEKVAKEERAAEDESRSRRGVKVGASQL